MMKKRFCYFVLAFFLVVISFQQSCITYTKTTGNKNFSYLYNPTQTTIHPNIQFYFKNSNELTMYMSFTNKNLKFIGNTTTIKMFYSVFTDFNNINTPLDSGIIIINPLKNAKQTHLELDLKIKNNTKFIIYLKITDEITKFAFENYYFFNNKSENYTYNFLITDSSTGKIISTNFINSTFKIQHNTSDTLYVYVYNFYNKIPNLPFSTKQFTFDFPEEKEDSFFVILNNEYISPKCGKVYLIKSNTELKGGKVVSCFYKGFPKVKTPYQMLLPLKYLTNKTEFENYLTYKDKKQAVDDFWLNYGKNKYNAKEMIKVYYNRVILSNIMFTDYKPGWQTDRGMIFIVFGPPKYVYKSSNSEKWIYSLSNTAPLEFVFNKYQNPYFENTYVLKRMLDYKSIWFQAVNTWRSGKVYAVSN